MGFKSSLKSQGTILHRFACRITFSHNLLILIHNLNENIVKHGSNWSCWKISILYLFPLFSSLHWHKGRGNLKGQKFFGRQKKGTAKQNNTNLYLGVIFFKNKLTVFICKNLLVTKGRGQKQIPGNPRNVWQTHLCISSTGLGYAFWIDGEMPGGQLQWSWTYRNIWEYL